MSKIISMFNHKGGVSKTTTTFNIGWMLANRGHRVLMVDADPQCNLTGVSLGLVNSWPPLDDLAQDAEDDQAFDAAQDRTADFFTANVDRTLYGALRPAFESEPRLLEPVDCFEIAGRSGLFVLPGHLKVGEYDVSLSIAHEMSGSLLPLKNVPGAIHHLLRLTAEALDVDYVLVDMSPSLGSLNQNIVATSDLLVVPTSPDFFSIMALRSLAEVLPRWQRWAQQASENPLLKTAAYAFPPPRFKLAGAVIQRYRLYRAPTEANPNGDPTRPFAEWIQRVSDSMTADFLPAMRAAGLLLPAEAYEAAGIDQDGVLARVQEFNSLLPKSQEHQKPVFELTVAELQQAGVVLENSEKQVRSLYRLFDDLCDRLGRLSAVQGTANDA